MPESAVDQRQNSHSSLIPMLYNKDDAYIQISPVQEQATQLWAILSENDTAMVYQQAAAKTWKLLKQTIVLLVFLFVLLIALVVWIWGIGFQSGLQFRTWLETEHPTLDELMTVLLKVLLYPFERAFAWANWFIKTYLGWEIHFGSPPSESSSTQPEQPSTSTPSETSTR
ncbi:MAG: hypothetical protein HC769_18250 [Cyanobacteria bacterium CRU_2_1]|nr:hypothetical protein [Cyanobacteria bacterium CRU_2_1]